MKKQKRNAPIKATLPTKKVKKMQRISQEPLAPPTKPVQAKRKVGDLSFFFRKEQSISPPTIQQKFSLQYFLKSSTFQCLVLQCPNLQNAIQKIKKKISIDKDLLYGVVERCLIGNKQLLWTDKYKPRNLKQCFSSQIGQKIKIWLKSFYFYRNSTFQESNSFIDDWLGQNSNTQIKNMKQFGWKLKGLIIKGRSGVGKTTTITATAKDLEYQIYHCGNECNQIKYLKQKNEATQSQCVKTKINKNQTHIQKTNKSITTFAIRNQEPQVQQQGKKIQFMHNVNMFYPEEDQTKFYNQLKKTIQSSKIPFLMTLTGEKTPDNLTIYDVIQFQQPKPEDISTLLYLIYHIQKSFALCMDLEKIVQKQKFKEVLNQQFYNFQFQINSPLIDFIRLTQIFNRKFDSLLTFIQISQKLENSLDLKHAEQMMKLSFKRANCDELMTDYFYLENQTTLEEDSLKQIGFEIIDTTKYLVQEQHQKQLSMEQQKKLSQQQDIPTLMCTPNKEEGYFQSQYFSKTKTNVKQKFEVPQKSLKQVAQELYLKVIDDYKPEVRNDQCYIFNKLYIQSREQLEEKLFHNISINCHKDIRKKILKNVKVEYQIQNEQITSIKEKQFHFLGFLIDSRTRVSRKKTNKQFLNLKKLLKNNQINYLNNFTNFLKPNSLETKH